MSCQNKDAEFDSINTALEDCATRETPADDERSFKWKLTTTKEESGQKQIEAICGRR